MRFFIDEDLSPTLVKDCHEAGYDASCSRDRGRLGSSDQAVAELCMDEDRILVTNNVADFLSLAKAASQEPAAMMVNRVVEIDEKGRCSHYDYP